MTRIALISLYIFTAVSFASACSGDKFSGAKNSKVDSAKLGEGEVVGDSSNSGSKKLTAAKPTEIAEGDDALLVPKQVISQPGHIVPSLNPGTPISSDSVPEIVETEPPAKVENSPTQNPPAQTEKLEFQVYDLRKEWGTALTSEQTVSCSSKDDVMVSCNTFEGPLGGLRCGSRIGLDGAGNSICSVNACNNVRSGNKWYTRYQCAKQIASSTGVQQGNANSSLKVSTQQVNFGTGNAVSGTLTCADPKDLILGCQTLAVPGGHTECGSEISFDPVTSRSSCKPGSCSGSAANIGSGQQWSTFLTCAHPTSDAKARFVKTYEKIVTSATGNSSAGIIVGCEGRDVPVRCYSMLLPSGASMCDTSLVRGSDGRQSCQTAGCSAIPGQYWELKAVCAAQ